MIKSVVIFPSFLSSHKISLCRQEIQRKKIIDRYLGNLCAQIRVVFILKFFMSYINLTVDTGGCIGSSWGNRREEDHWGDLGVDGCIILRWISRRWDMGMWTGLGWRTLVNAVMNLWVP